MRRARLLSLIVGCWLAACAQGVPAGSSGDDEPAAPDAGFAADAPQGDTPDASVPDTDAPPGAPDAAPSAPDARPAGPITLSQTTSDAITVDAAGCRNGLRENGENRYYRAFKLADHGVTGALAVSEVAFGVYRASSDLFSVSQPVAVRLHTLSGDVVRADRLTSLGEASVQVPDTSTATNVTVPITATVPAGATLVVEVAVVRSSHTFYLGANTGGESKPAYWTSAECSESMADLASQSDPPAHAQIRVTGTPR